MTTNYVEAYLELTFSIPQEEEGGPQLRKTTIPVEISTELLDASRDGVAKVIECRFLLAGSDPAAEEAAA